jgi:hypothetical protein
MNAELKSPESLLREARERLRQEWTHLQTVGRPHAWGSASGRELEPGDPTVG